MPKRFAAIFAAAFAMLFAAQGLLPAGEAGGAKEGRKGSFLEDVVVTAGREKTTAFNTPQSVSVISRDSLDSSPFERVEDVIRITAGLQNFRHFALQANGIVGPLIIRGVGANRTLLMIDGVPQNDNFNNAISWVAWGHVPREAIERIEIVRGPTSTLHGSEGLGGAVNVITKTPSGKRGTSLNAYGGSAHTYGGAVNHCQKIGGFGFASWGSYEQSDGFVMTDEPQEWDIPRLRRVGRVFGKVRLDLNDSSRVSLSSLYYDHMTGKGRKYFYDDLTLHQHWAQYSQTFDSFRLDCTLFVNVADKIAAQDSSTDNYTSLLRKEMMLAMTWGADVQGSLQLSKWAKTVFGASYKGLSWDYDDDYVNSLRDAGGKGKQQIASCFASMNVVLEDIGLIANLGVRADWIQTYDGSNWDSQASAGRPAYDNHFDPAESSAFSPKIGVVWHPDKKTALRASLGRGFRAASLFELYKVHVRGGGTYYREANPYLKPEEIWSWDVGVERRVMEFLWARVAFYQSWATNYIGDRLIGTTPISGGRTRYDYVIDNVSAVAILGLEAEMKWSPLKELEFFANYTWNVSQVTRDDNNPQLEGKYLPNDPRHKGHAGLKYRNKEFADVSIVFNYYADIYYDAENTISSRDHWTLDLSVSRTFDERFKVYLSIENVFDRKYPIFLSTSSGNTIAPGIVITCGVKTDF